MHLLSKIPRRSPEVTPVYPYRRFFLFSKCRLQWDEDRVSWSLRLRVEPYGGYVIVIMARKVSCSGHLGKLNGKLGASG